MNGRFTTDTGQNPGATPEMGEVVIASLKAMQTMLDCGVVGLLRGG